MIATSIPKNTPVPILWREAEPGPLANTIGSIPRTIAKEVIMKFDKSDGNVPLAVESPVLGVISPEKLSGGTKTLLLMANDPEKVFNASTCGDNCAPFILKLAKKKD